MNHTNDEMKVIRAVWEIWKKQQSLQRNDAVSAKTLQGVQRQPMNMGDNKDQELSAGPLVAGPTTGPR